MSFVRQPAWMLVAFLPMSDELKTLRREVRAWRRLYREAWEALALIREAVEEHGGQVTAGEYVQPPTLFGEAEALVRGINRIARRPRRKKKARIASDAPELPLCPEQSRRPSLEPDC
jgi:hypothetical protein